MWQYVYTTSKICLCCFFTIYIQCVYRSTTKPQDAHVSVLQASEEKCWNRKESVAWKEAGARWRKRSKKKKKKKSSWVQLNGKRADRVYVASSCSVRLFLATVGARSSGFGGSLVSSWGTTTEQSRWRIITGLIASAPLTHPHLLKGDPWGFLLLSRSQRSPVLPLSRYDGCARLWPSPLTCVFIPNHSSACRGRIIHSDITMERKTHKVNINLLIFNSNSAAGQMARF